MGPLTLSSSPHMLKSGLLLLGKNLSSELTFACLSNHLGIRRAKELALISTNSIPLFDFAVLYCGDNGRDSVPPSLLATVLLLQAHDRVSDAEAKARADFDLRWKSLPSATTGGSPWDRGGG